MGILLGQRQKKKKLVATLTVLQLLQVFPGKQGLEWNSAVLQQRVQTVRRKTKKQKYFFINNLDVHSETQLESQQLLR